VRFSFAEPIGGEVVTTLRVAPEQPGQVQRGHVQEMGPYVTASALLHQALWPAEAREAYRRRYPFAEYGGHVWASIAELDAFLDRVRPAGCAEPRFPNDSHYRVAAAVFGEGRRFAGALGGYLPAAYEFALFDPAALRDAVCTAAGSVSAA
jgi:DNA-binding IclR family transcriptional regulator